MRIAWLTALAVVSACGEPGYVLFLKPPVDTLDAAADGGGGSGGTALGPPADAQAGSDAGTFVCGNYVAGAHFEVCASTYLTGPGDDAAKAVLVTPAGEVWVGGVFSGELGVPESTLLAGAGAVVRLDATGTRLLSVTRLGASVDDMALLGSSGDVAVVGSFGVAVLSGTADALRWVKPLPSTAARLAVGRQGTLAVLTTTGDVHVFDTDGASMGTFETADAFVDDVAVDDDSGSLFLVGANPVRAGSCLGLMPFLRSYDLSGNVQWVNYDFDDGGSWCASSRGRRAVLGEDGKLYYAGENQGGNTVHQRNPKDLGQGAPLVSYDVYTASYGNATDWYGFVARLEPSTGLMESGQVLLPREEQMGSFLRIHALAVDAHGVLYLGGEAGCCLAERDQLSVGGESVGSYREGDNFLSIIDADFQRRLSWVTWTRTNASASTMAVAVGAGIGASVTVQPSSGGDLITTRALMGTPLGGSEAFVSVWPAPAM